MEKFSKLPGPVKGGIAVGGGGGLMVAGLLMGTGKWVFLAILVLFLALMLGAFFLWRAWQRKKQAARMSGELQQHSSASPRAISDPGARARLDDLRKKFDQGVQEYRSRGKDLYTLPWYVIVGEPGSGKTEAIRHSNVGFPPGMQDEFQGVGGTINMNWWFTNNAVLLDTAGRLMFEEVKPGEQSEWKEFLNLLKKNRLNCPINGLFLVIPSDSLIKDSADDIARKAGKIAQQLDVIQRVLDVRFPVYVVVTKCDKINGFREFFDGLTDPQLQHQMMGWSNPDPLDTAFRPDLVDQHLDKVVNRLRRRRMGALRDPMPENQTGRRADEVDSLFALPHSLRLLAPRLRRYLETIFVAGEWSAKPLFLRGIYFTSSMREGAALDEELARAIGVGVEELGEEKVWERERAYFLRDLFLEKVFREKGLVTRATNTNKMLRSRQLALYGAGSAALVLFIVLAWFAMNDLGSSVKDQSEAWVTVRKAGWSQNNTWKQSIVPFEGGAYVDRVTNYVALDRGRVPIGEYHAKLREQATKRARRGFLSFVFPGVYRNFETQSKRAQRIVFENGVVKPLIDASRQKIERDLSRDSEAQNRLPDALAALIELEGDIIGRGQRETHRQLTTGDADKFLTRLMSFVAGQDAKPDPKLVSTMVATYTSDDENGWPSPWLSGTVGATPGLAANRSISRGLDRLREIAEAATAKSTQDWKQVTALRAAFEEFSSGESDLSSMAAAKTDIPRFVSRLQQVGSAFTNIEQQLRSESIAALPAPFSLSNAFYQVQTVAVIRSSGALEKVSQAYDKSLKPQGKQTNRFAVEVGAKLSDLRKHLRSRGEELFRTDRPEQLTKLDASLVASNAFRLRGENYARVFEATTTDRFKADPIGLRGQPLDDRLATHAQGREAAARYHGPFEQEFQQTMRFAWELADSMQRQKFIAVYLDSATNRIKPRVRFPICNSTSGPGLALQAFEQLTRDLELISKDVNAPSLQGAQFKDNANWQSFSNRVAGYYSLARALLDESYKPITCSISLAPYQGPPRDVWRDYWRNIWIDPERKVRTGNAEFEKLGDIMIDRTMAFTLEDNNGTRENGPVLGDWAALRLLFNHADTAVRATTGNSWTVQVPTGKDGKTAGSIAVKIDFAAPLPEIKQWCKPL
jgi:hypothetical protein